MQVAMPIVCIGIKDTDIPNDPEELSKRDIAVQIIADICFGKSSEFFARLYRDGLISSPLGCWNMQNEAFSFLSFSTDTSDPNELYRRFIEYTELSLISAIDEDSFERSRRVIYADFVKGFDSTDEISNTLITDFVLERSEMFKFADHIRSMTVEYVKNVATQLFKAGKYTMSVVLPIDNKEEEK
jgi:predicted Zn-dependent peptidase